MIVCDQPEAGAEASARDLIAKRARPQIILLDVAYNVVVAEWDTGFALFRQLGLEARYATRLLPQVEDAVRAVVERLAADPLTDSTIHVIDSLIIRVSLLESRGDRGHITLFVEPSRRREDLKGAAKRFNLTNRQIEVLGFILQGQSAKEIAETLSISETTVGDYFKQLMMRTSARNRADMVARVLHWNDSERTRIPVK